MIEPTLDLTVSVEDPMSASLADTDVCGVEATAYAAHDTIINSTLEFVGYDDQLAVSQQDMDILEEKADDMDRAEISDGDFDCSYKLCATRHGCSGATNCDACYGDYHR